MEHSEWIKTLYDGATPTTAARRAGLAHTTVLRQLERGGIDAGHVIALARFYGRDVISSLVDTGHVLQSEVEAQDPRLALGYATNADLHAELLRRVDPEARRLLENEDLVGGDVIEPDFGSWDIPPSAVAHRIEDDAGEDSELD